MLDTFAKAPPRSDQPLRMPVQAVYKFTSQGDDRRIVAGRIEAGRVHGGRQGGVLARRTSRPPSRASRPSTRPAPRTEIEAGWSTGFTLAEEIYITRGEVMSHVGAPPLVSTRFRANLIWLGKKPFEKGRDYKLKLHTAARAGAHPQDQQGHRRLAR